MTSKEALEDLYGSLLEREHTDSKHNLWLQMYQIEKELHKLEQLEEIEKELGIDLITLFKALKDGVWVKNEFGQIYYTNVYLYDLSLSHSSDKNRFCFVMDNNIFLSFEDCGEKWALTEEELENERKKSS